MPEFAVLRQGGAGKRLFLVLDFRKSGMDHFVHCIIGKGQGYVALESIKQVSDMSIQGRILQRYKTDADHTAVVCSLDPGTFGAPQFKDIISRTAEKFFKIPYNAPVRGMQLAKVLFNADGQVAWANLVNNGLPQAEAPEPEEDDPSMLLDDDDDEESSDFLSLLSDDEEPSEPGSVTQDAERGETVLPRLAKVGGLEEKILDFTQTYSKILSVVVRAAREGAKALEKQLKPSVKEIQKALKEMRCQGVEFFPVEVEGVSKNLTGAVYIKKLTVNMADVQKDAGRLLKILTAEITEAKKAREADSVDIEFLFKNRFMALPDFKDRLRDLLRLTYGRPLPFSEDYSFVTQKIDLTKHYYLYHSKDLNKRVATDIFFFADLGNVLGTIYAPYTYLGTGALNSLLADFLAKAQSAV